VHEGPQVIQVLNRIWAVTHGPVRQEVEFTRGNSR
jgi:hypothetical protein